MPAKPRGGPASARSEERPKALPSAELIPFPLASRRPLVGDLAAHFLGLPRGRRRLALFDKTIAGLVEELRTLGITAERAELEVAPVMNAVELEIERRLLAREGRPA